MDPFNNNVPTLYALFRSTTVPLYNRLAAMSFTSKYLSKQANSVRYTCIQQYCHFSVRVCILKLVFITMAARQAINRPNFSSPILSEAIIHDGLIYASGKIGLDAKTGTLVSDDVAEQTVSSMTLVKCLDINKRKKTALGLLESVLIEAGSGLHKIIKVILAKGFVVNNIDKRVVQHLPDEHCRFRSHEHHLYVLPRLSLRNTADNSADIATIPNPKPARVCVTVADLGRGAKVFVPCHISRKSQTNSKLSKG